jgi:hypothetical protein
VRFERSTYEHVQALDFFLHACVLASLNGIVVGREFEETLRKMLELLCLLGRAGAPPGLGRNQGGRVFDSRRNLPEHLLDPLTTGAVLFGRGDFKSLAGGFREESLWLLGEQGLSEFDQLPARSPDFAPAALSESGLYLMAGAGQSEQLVVDARPQRPVFPFTGRALSISINRGGQPLLIDPESSEFSDQQTFSGGSGNILYARQTMQGKSGPTKVSTLRRSPGAATEAATRAATKAETWITGRNFDLFVGSHGGAGGSEISALHRRWIFSLRGNFWLVRDLAMGEGMHNLELLWHLCPELSRYDGRSGVFADARGSRGLRMLAAEGHGWSQEIRRGWWSPLCGRQEPLTLLRYSTVSQLPVEFVTLLAPLTGEPDPGGGLYSARQSPIRGVVSGYCYDLPEEEHYIYFGEGRAWTMGLWSSDAEFLYWSKRRDERSLMLICCNASYVEAAGRRVISCGGAAARNELVLAGENLEAFSSDPKAEINRQALDATLVLLEPQATSRLRRAAGQ